MDYTLAVDDSPTTIPGGAGLLLLQPDIGATDRIDTDFLKVDTDRFLVVSTRTTAREVEQKLEHYDVDESRAEILDALSIDRGYSRRSSDRLHYVSAPDDTEGIVAVVREFLESTEGKRRLSVDSLTEIAYYADEDRACETARELLALLDDHDAVGLFHLSKEVHDEATLGRFREPFDGVVDLAADGGVTCDFD